jgi:hypothetical protein
MHKWIRDCDEHCSREIKKTPVFYWLQASAFARLCRGDTRKEDISHISTIKKGIYRQKRRLKRGHRVTDIVNIFLLNISLLIVLSTLWV